LGFQTIDHRVRLGQDDGRRQPPHWYGLLDPFQHRAVLARDQRRAVAAGTDVHQVVTALVGEHSAKPEEVRRRIEQLFLGPYLELYGRKPVDNWCVWGNEIASPLKAPPGAGADDDLSIPPFLRRASP
jgi:N6-adenosine-specific RNA methylase IME4